MRRVSSGARCSIFETIADARVWPLRIDDIWPTNETCLGAAAAATISGRASVPAGSGGGAACAKRGAGAGEAAQQGEREQRSAAEREASGRTVGVVESRGVGGIDVRSGGRGAAILASR